MTPDRHALETIPSTLAALGTELADTAMAAGSSTGAPAVGIGAPDAPRYARQAPLGQGGMGVVERARDRDLLRDVAIKLLRPELRADGALLEQFLWEARVTAYLDHPNIVPVHDVGLTPEGQLFFTMKLVRGTTLAAALQRADAGEFGLRRRLRAFLQLCQAVSFAHARGVLHRDLKPANVMLGEYGEVLVTDWGLALPIESDAGRQLAPLVPGGIATRSAGTPSYMSPEQARGGPLDERSDVYTLGVILYELVALRRAYDGPTTREILDRVAAGDAPPLAAVCPRAPRALGAVVARAMATDPAKRYPSVRTLAGDLEIAMDGGTPEADDAGLVTQLGRFYMARVSGPGQIGELRHLDLDTWLLGSGLIGAGTGAVLEPWLGSAWWALLAAGVVLAAIPTVRWLRVRRAHRAEAAERDR